MIGISLPPVSVYHRFTLGKPAYLAVVRYVCDRIVVLYLGRVMEVARATDLFLQPLQPTQATTLAMSLICPLMLHHKDFVLPGSVRTFHSSALVITI